MIRTSTIGLNNQAAQKMVNRYFRSNELNVVHGFTPVKSEYTFSTSPKSRVKVSLGESTFSYVKELLKDGKWLPEKMNVIKGSRNEVENSFINTISKFVRGIK